MGLICNLSGHRADAAGARWNAGIYFGRCARCGTDLVRSASGSWQAPRGYRVVWRAAAEVRDLAPAEPAPAETSAPPALPSRETLFERLKADAGTSTAAREDAEPEPTVPALPEPSEWPIEAVPPGDEFGGEDACSVPEASSPVQELVEESSRAKSDFMDDVSDSDEWDDFLAERASGAYA